MILINFSQKMHNVQFEQFTALTSEEITEQVMVPLETADENLETSLDHAFARVKLTDAELQAGRVVVNLPQQSARAIKVIAYIRRHAGRLPLVLRTHTSTFGLSAGPAVVEVLDLEELFS